MLTGKKICFIGAGSMAEAIVSGMLQQSICQPEQISMINASNQQRLAQLASMYNITIAPEHPTKLIKEADILLLAMKPKDAHAALEKMKEYTSQKQIIISVLAGISTSFISSVFGHEAPVIRTMPNTSASIGLSATGISAGVYAKEEHVVLARHIFASIGTVVTVEERKIDAVTGVSGSGPAYIYYLVESMTEGALDLGLDESQARELVIQTLIGAAQMLKQTGEDPVILRKKVTSPNGTTQAGIELLMQHQFKDIMKKCITRASERSKEIEEAFSKMD